MTVDVHGLLCHSYLAQVEESHGTLLASLGDAEANLGQTISDVFKQTDPIKNNGLGKSRNLA